MTPRRMKPASRLIDLEAQSVRDANARGVPDATSLIRGHNVARVATADPGIAWPSSIPAGAIFERG